MTKQVTLRIMVLTATSFMCNHDVRKQTNMFLLLINFLNWKYLSMELFCVSMSSIRVHRKTIVTRVGQGVKEGDTMNWNLIQLLRINV